MTYRTDVEAARGLVGRMKEMKPEAIAAKMDTSKIAADSMATMADASAAAKTSIRDRVTRTTELFTRISGDFFAVDLEGNAPEAMRTANEDLTTNIKNLDERLNNAFDDLDREIKELGAEVQAVVDEFGTNFEKSGEVAESGWQALQQYTDSADELFNRSVTYG